LFTVKGIFTPSYFLSRLHPPPPFGRGRTKEREGKKIEEEGRRRGGSTN